MALCLLKSKIVRVESARHFGINAVLELRQWILGLGRVPLQYQPLVTKINYRIEIKN